MAAKQKFNPADNLPPPKPKSPAGTTKSTRNHEEPWTKATEKELKGLIGENTPTRVIGLKLGRTESSVRDKVREMNLSLRPANQSPNKPKLKK
jgi:hypothetical protein